MARRNASLKPHLNQIRTWVGEGVTDIWIAHQLESTPASIAAFRRQHGLSRGGAEPEPIPAAVAAAGMATAAPLGDVDADADLDATEPAATETPTAAGDTDSADGTPKRRRRGRRGGRGRGTRSRSAAASQAQVEPSAEGLIIRIDAAALAGSGGLEAWQNVTAATVTASAEGLLIVPAGAGDDDSDTADAPDEP